MLVLGEIAHYGEQEILEMLATQYTGQQYSYSNNDEEVAATKELLSTKEVLIAYQHTGDYGCDSSSFFLLRDRVTGELFEQHGSHCSCYGFEGQFHLEPTNMKALKYRLEEGGRIFGYGGYDNEVAENDQRVKDFININFQ